MFLYIIYVEVLSCDPARLNLIHFGTWGAGPCMKVGNINTCEALVIWNISQLCMGLTECCQESQT